MMLTKMFASRAGYFTSPAKTATQLEGEINAWLGARPDVRVVHIRQSSNGGSLEPSKVWISIWYEPGTGQDEQPSNDPMQTDRPSAGR